MIQKVNAILKHVWPVMLRIMSAATISIIGGLMGGWVKKWIDRYYNINVKIQ